ncbi:HD domain-containing protein [Roseibium alexandrii]
MTTICRTKHKAPIMGSLAWGERKGAFSEGRLTRAEKFTVIGNMVRMSLLQALDLASDRLGLMNAYGADLDGLLPMQTRLVSDSQALASEKLGTDVLEHSWRTYYWAMCLAGYKKLDVDREILFSAAMLHDLGLAKDRPVHPGTCCFTVHGAKRSKDLLVSQGHDPAKARKIGEAIGLHLNGYVSRRLHGAEAHLLSRGAMCDVFGMGRARIAGSTRREVQNRHLKGDLMNGLEIWPGHHLQGTRGDFLIRVGGKHHTATIPKDKLLVAPRT